MAQHVPTQYFYRKMEVTIGTGSKIRSQQYSQCRVQQALVAVQAQLILNGHFDGRTQARIHKYLYRMFSEYQVSGIIGITLKIRSQIGLKQQDAGIRSHKYFYRNMEGTIRTASKIRSWQYRQYMAQQALVAVQAQLISNGHFDGRAKARIHEYLSKIFSEYQVSGTIGIGLKIRSW